LVIQLFLFNITNLIQIKQVSIYEFTPTVYDHSMDGVKMTGIAEYMIEQSKMILRKLPNCLI